MTQNASVGGGQSNSSQANKDNNTNSGMVGEIEASVGGVSDFLNATSSASSTATGYGTFNVGDKSVASGSAVAGKLGTFKTLAIVSLCFVGWLAYRKWGK